MDGLGGGRGAFRRGEVLPLRAPRDLERGGYVLVVADHGEALRPGGGAAQVGEQNAGFAGHRAEGFVLSEILHSQAHGRPWVVVHDLEAVLVYLKLATGQDTGRERAGEVRCYVALSRRGSGDTEGRPLEDVQATGLV